MAFIKVIEDDAGNKLAELVTTHDCYLLPDGTQMFVHAYAAWCHRCRSFTLVESLESFEDMEKNLHSIFATKWAKDQLDTEVRDLLLHQIEQWRLVMNTRRSPAKCLSCGTSAYIKLPQDGGWMDHPSQPGRKVRVNDARIHACMAERGDLFDTEGNCILGMRASM